MIRNKLLSDSEGSLATFLVTGANRGIGLEFCRQLQARHDQVIAVCRQASPELEAIGVEMQSGIELSSEASISALVQNLRSRSLDGVILNAGILQSMDLETHGLQSPSIEDHSIQPPTIQVLN